MHARVFEARWGVIPAGSSGFGPATAHELAAHGMNVCLEGRLGDGNRGEPGVTETPAQAAIAGSAQLEALALGRNPFGRLTRPSDVANAVFLLSLDEAAWINGVLVRVDGGEHVAGATS